MAMRGGDCTEKPGHGRQRLANSMRTTSVDRLDRVLSPGCRGKQQGASGKQSGYGGSPLGHGRVLLM
jgi:hypothetical protein